MEPSAKVHFITTGGAELRADWSEAAKINFDTHFHSQLSDAGYSVIKFDPEQEKADTLEQLLLLYEVASSQTGLVMPHKGKGITANANLTLGKDAQILKEAHGTDDALFVTHYSQIESGGVFASQVAIAALTGYAPASQNVRLTDGRMVDLETGDFGKAFTAYGGDPRDETESFGITERILQKILAE